MPLVKAFYNGQIRGSCQTEEEANLKKKLLDKLSATASATSSTSRYGNFIPLPVLPSKFVRPLNEFLLFLKFLSFYQDEHFPRAKNAQGNNKFFDKLSFGILIFEVDNNSSFRKILRTVCSVFSARKSLVELRFV